MKPFSPARIVRALCSLLLLSLPLSLRAQAADGAPVTLYGSQIYAESGTEWGIYSFPAAPGATFTPVWRDGDLMANGGAVYAGGKYYIVSFLDFGFTTYGIYLTCDVEKQEMQVREIDDWNLSYLTTDMTCDPLSGTIYACSLSAEADGTFNLSTMDAATGRQTPVAPMPQMCALAASPRGTLYGIAQADGTLYTIDPATAALTPVGPTGVQPASNLQSATFDPATGLLYWSAYTDEGGALYTVDPVTARATLVTTYPDRIEMVGLYIPASTAEAAAPARPENFEADFERDALSGTARFVMPAADINGNPLGGPLGYRIQLGTATLAQGNAQPAEAVSCPLTVPADDLYTFSLTASNEAGASTAVQLTRYVGMDLPAAPTALTATADSEGCVALTWTAPAGGKNNGYTDPSQFTYSVTRQPDGTLVSDRQSATGLTDAFRPDELTAVYYTVTPHIGTRSGDSAHSPLTAVGDHKNVPYREDFSHWTHFALFDVADVNADQATWQYDFDLACLRYLWAYDDVNNDWLFTPPVRLEQGRYYTFSARLHSESDRYSAAVALACGTEATPEGMTHLLLPATDVDRAEALELCGEAFTPEADGNYRFGIHATGPRSIYYLLLNSLSVTDVTAAALADPTSAEARRPVVLPTAQGIRVLNPDGLTVRIYTAAGRLLHTTAQTDFVRPLPRGIYLVQCGAYSQKISR